jgi:tRNA-2-methylthio-N6-dimethylallyladenosine synthase
MVSKRVYIETYGCQMNEHDSERILRLLGQCRYIETKKPGEADLILVNTCSVREKPEQKVYSALGRFKRLKEERGAIIGVAGCVAQQEGDRLLSRIPYLDLVVGTHAIPMLPQLIEKIEVSGQRVSETGFDTGIDYLREALPAASQGKVKSYVTIMQGCDRFCSYCVVPYVRGREKSRPSGEILEEIEALADSGVKEVCLLGQNVNGYGKGLEGEPGFSGLLDRIDEIEGIERIRFTTSHPADLSEELIRSFGRLEKLCEHFHLPFQSGSNRILERMNRGYTRETYLEKIDRLKQACPSIAFTADVIVGFPGEEEEDFQQTLDLMARVRFDDLYSFKYSPRKETKAARFEDKVQEEVKQERLSILQGIQREITLQKNKKLESRVEEVLVEGRSKQNTKDVAGRTRTNKVVNFEGGLELTGKLVPVRIVTAYAHSLRGERMGHRA